MAERVLMKAERSWAWFRVGDMMATKTVVSKEEGVDGASSPGLEEPGMMVSRVRWLRLGEEDAPDLFA